MRVTFHFHPRLAAPDCPAGFTVSRSANLPTGDFVINEYSWGPVTLWFVQDDEFTDDERQVAYRAFVEEIAALNESEAKQ